MAASPDVETDLLSEGSPLRSPSPEVGVGDDVPAEPPMPEPRGDDSESEDDDRRRVKRDRDEPEPEPEPDAAKRPTPSTGPGGSGGRGRGRGDQPHGGRGANPPTAGPASGRGGSGAPAGRGGRGGRGPSPPFQRAPSRDRFANGHGGDGAHAPYPGHVEVTRVFTAPGGPVDRRSLGPTSHGMNQGTSEPSSRPARNAHAEYPRAPPTQTHAQQHTRDMGASNTHATGHARDRDPGYIRDPGSNPYGHHPSAMTAMTATTTRFPDRASPATLDDALAIFATRADVSRLCAADERGPAPVGADAVHFASRKNSYDPRVAVEALHAARGAIVRVGVGSNAHAGERWEIAELAGGAADSGAGAGASALPVLRLFDRSGRVTERATELGALSNSAPSPREWDAYVESCAAAAAAGAGPPPPRVGDVEAVRDALDWTFRRDNGGAGRAYDLPPPRAGGYGPPPFGFSVNTSRVAETARVAERGSWDERAPSLNLSSRDVAYRADLGIPRVGQKRRPPSPVAAYDRAPEAAPALSRRRVENDLHAHSNAPASLDRDPNESSWVMDTRGNNGLVVGVRGENVKRVERETGARVRCEKDKSTVVLSGTPAEVALARRMVEATLRQAGIEPGGAHGGGAPVPEDEVVSSPGRERTRGGPGEDLRARLTSAGANEHKIGVLSESLNGDDGAKRREPTSDPRDAEPKATVVAAPAPDHPSPDAGDAANGTESKPGFVAAVDCGGPRGLSLALGGRDASDLVGENLAALRASCGTQCAFDVDEAALRVVVRAPDASACAVAAEMVASIANREFTGMVTKKNLSNRFAAGMRAAEMLRTRREAAGDGGDDDSADITKECDVLIHVGKDLGAVIGAKGATILRLQKASACVMTTDNKAKTVRVVGATPEITKKGEEMIRAAIQKVQEVAATRGSGPGRGRGRGAEGRGGRGRGRGRG